MIAIARIASIIRARAASCQEPILMSPGDVPTDPFSSIAAIS